MIRALRRWRWSCPICSAKGNKLLSRAEASSNGKKHLFHTHGIRGDAILRRED